MENKVDNNNSFWSVDKSLSFDDMKELGVDVLPDKNEVLPERKKRERPAIKSEDIVYNDFNAVEAKEFEESHKAKYIKADKFLFRSKQKSINISKDVFSGLSDEIVLGIFKYLTHEDLKYASQVNHRFRRLSHDESLWPRIDLANKTLNSNSLIYIMKRGVKVLRLKEAKVNSPIWHKSFDQRLSNYHSKIEYLDLSYSLISDEDLALFLSKCRSIRKLSLESCQVSLEVCKEIAKNPKLDTLNLAMVEGLENDGLREICSSCNRLQSVNLAWTKLSREAVNVFVNTVSESLINLNLSGLAYTVDDSNLITLIGRCPGLIELDISDCLEVTTAAVPAIADGLTNIRTFSVSRCYKIDPKKILDVLGKMSSLRSLTAFRVIGHQEARELEAKYSLLRVNKEYFSTVARPTTGVRRTSIWLVRCRE